MSIYELMQPCADIGSEYYDKKLLLYSFPYQHVENEDNMVRQTRRYF